MTEDLDHTRRYKIAGEPSRGRRRPGLALDVLGWPWHPRRRLATARYRGRNEDRGSGGSPPQDPPPASG